MSPRLALVISRSATGRSLRARASVVVIRPCSNSAVARFASMWRSCAGDPPRRAPLVGVGMVSPRVKRLRGTRPPAVPRSVLLVLGVGLVVVAVGVHGSRGVEAGRTVLERQAHGGQLGLDLVDRLLAEVADVEQVGFAARD